MNKKIFRSVFFTSIFVLGISFLMISSVLFNYFEAQIFSELENEANYITYGIKYNPNEFLQNFKSENKRITIISPQGDVLNDTMADVNELESHADRKEFKDAMENGIGKSERYSETLTEKTLYFAVKLDNGNILRVSTTQNSVVTILLGLMQPLFFIILILLIISLFLAYKVSNAIIKPINNLDLDNPEMNTAYEELTPLLKKLTAQKKTIKRQIYDAEKSREEFKLICENMNEGFLVIDKDAKVLSYNPAALKLLQIGELSDNNVLTINRTKNFRETISKALSGKRSENTVVTDERIYNLIANPVYASAKIIGAVIIIIDVTEKSKREQLRQEFTSNVSHELKTPLTSISGFAEMMKSGDTPQETVVDFSTSIYEEAKRLITLVSDIMKISELDEDAVLIDKERIDLYSLAKDISDRLRPTCAKQNITISVIGEKAYIIGVRKILDEMLYNLCDNAIKYNKLNGTVDIIINTSPDKVTLTVRDSGIGIARNEQERIFERFYRVDKSRSKSAGGTGLGLAIVKHGAIYHNAAININSCEGEGTSISLTFENADII